MIFFFGTRASKIKDRKISRTTCSYCETKDSFIVSTFSKYFHFFWIPIIPLFKTNVAECSHCKKTYAQHQFTPEMKAALHKENEINPAKRPIWQGIGCILLVGFFLLTFGLSLIGVYYGSNKKPKNLTNKDPRMELLENDIKKISPVLKGDKDSVSIALKDCIDYDIQSGIDTDKIEYFSVIQENRILVLLGIKDLKGIKPSERKVIIDVVEDCLSAMPYLDGVHQRYISIEGKWNTVLVKTPTDEDLGGRFADKYKLLPFYGEKPVVKDSIPTKVDTIPM
ncbi:zinc-ribbon domain-containing protein [Maribacter algarum]|uniref:Zinc-ribbon domain-containing protein n=1 Tax=Maribacter algarum (ex Zhang et al. 2020) TaxID=2578118 RepID=A0A5S3QFN9_9FLAO|nr:zinc-ribbon domain-containing protein [Maribacter algarum]TMM56097.1 zinc-ribbon domain-containing protein [Maribacter algarum]